MTDSSGSQYEEDGYYGDKEVDIFMGLRHLNALTLNKDGTIRPHVLEVILWISDVKYFAAYNNFTVGSSTEGYAITSLGTYHGNAGDAMCPHVHLAFARDSNNIGWWGEADTRDELIQEEKGCLLTTKSMIWLPLKDDRGITNATMRIRPLEYDQSVACPPTVGWEPYWNTTTGNWTLNRSLSAIITWNCIGNMMLEPMTKAASGALECVENSNGSLSWNDTIKLPCHMVCPENFNASYDETRCYHFAAADAVVAGLHQAAVKGQTVYPALPVDDDFINCTDEAGDCDVSNVCTAVVHLMHNVPCVIL
ncbi:Fibrinogen alpha/beta/gamma chain C-terminal globular domain [Trinorchestia longiramus]|nr:Fibrinogen alpha/beta/gamma chain C-terminal globular domain [Trinorchestia longiramus]